jgi:putative Holliday junction resolvase
MIIACLDYGERYVGVALTDPDGRLALRHSVIDQKKQDALVGIVALVEKEEVERVLIGLPVSLSGRESTQTLITQQFIERLREKLPSEIAIQNVDETLTSVEAERRVKAEGSPSSEAHAEAARIMLEDYLRSAV